MKFLDYIKGQRKGKDANRIERNSMTDPFLYEAIDGFDSIDDKHIERINSIQNRIRANQKRRTGFSGLRIVAIIAVLAFALGGFLFIDYHKSNLQAQESGSQTIINVYVPETYYIENITTIAKRNTETVKTTKLAITKFQIEKDIDPSISEEEKTAFEAAKQNEIPIEIYLPDESGKRAFDRSR